jgi:hypothetical protein
MDEKPLAEKIERLEQLVLAADETNSDRDRYLLELAALHLLNPNIDPASANWTGLKLTELLELFYSGRRNIQLDSGDRRSAFSRKGRDPHLGVRWPTRILFEYDTLNQEGLKGEDVFFRISKRGVPFSPSTIKSLYYMAEKNPSYRKELLSLYKRFGFPKNRRISGKF